MNNINIKKIVEIININIENTTITLDNLYDDLLELGMDSQVFIKIIISLEDEYKYEFPDSMLVLSELNSIDKIYNALLSFSDKVDDNNEIS